MPFASAETQRLKGVPCSGSLAFDLLSSLHAVRIEWASAFTQRENGVPGSGSFAFDLLSPCDAHTLPRARFDAGVTGVVAGRLSVPGLSVPVLGGVTVGRWSRPLWGPA